MSFWQRLTSRNFDWILAVAMCLLVAIGLSAIYSVDLSQGSELYFFKKQLLAFGIGLVIFFVASFYEYTFFKNYAKWVYFFSLLLLVLVLFFGATINGTTGWFRLPGFSFQPAELSKVGLILMLGLITFNFGRRFDRPLYFFGTMFITLLPIGLIMLQPDLGSALLLGATWFCFMWFIGANKKLLTLTVVLSVLVGVFSWFFLFQDYQKDRVLTFLNPEHDPLHSGYNVIQSTIAVGSGQLFGRGLGFGSQSQLRFLPETQTDFVFSVIGEELGFAGVLLLITIYFIILWRLLNIVRKSKNDFISSVVSCVIILLFIQFFVNIGANIGILPVTGVPLPFVSSGGSSLLINMSLLGMAQSMIKKRY